MAYQSVDQLQKLLTNEVFHYAQDSKKAAGRALGTLVEVITFYLLQAWGLSESIGIERGLTEYGNKSIRHNVEYSLHPISSIDSMVLANLTPPLTSKKLIKALGGRVEGLDACEPSNYELLSSQGILRNACIVAAKADDVFVVLSMIDWTVALPYG